MLTTKYSKIVATMTDTAFVLKQVTQNWCCLFARPSAHALSVVNFSEFMAYAERLLESELENLIFTDFFFITYALLIYVKISELRT